MLSSLLGIRLSGESPPGRRSPCPGRRARVQSWRSRNSRYAIPVKPLAMRYANRSGAPVLSAVPGCAHPRDTLAGFLLSKSMEPVPWREQHEDEDQDDRKVVLPGAPLVRPEKRLGKDLAEARHINPQAPRRQSLRRACAPRDRSKLWLPGCA